MTIKELENKTGMARANIRFYEGEGLLAPKRLDNGYRDYSEEDARTLEKIKLLRQIGLDIDTIRKVQNGALTLEQALFTQHTKLEGDKVMLERAAEVCQALERSGVEYGALDPQPYLRQLEAPPALERFTLPPSPPKPERDDTPRACYHPWQRWLARILDMTLYGAPFEVFMLVVLRDQSIASISVNPFGQWFLGLLSLVFALAVEPFWLRFWGWTPGKWVFGLKLRDGEGKKLTLDQGFRRSRALIWNGYGLNIPFYSLWRFWKCRELGLDGRDCHWDGENDYRYTKEERRFAGWIFAGVQAVYIAVIALALLYTRTPLNQGPLTVEEYAENYNYYFKQLVDQNSTALPSLSENGHWLERDALTGTVVISFDDTTWAEPEITFTGGYVTAVTLRMESENWIVSTGTREMLAMLALSGSVDGTDLFHYNLAGWVKTAKEVLGQWENMELDYRGLHISQQVEYNGYLATSDGVLLSEDENIPAHCQKTVTISVID